MIKAIETTYKGYRFRSRLEARYACFFDVNRMEWEYEKEGYSLPCGAYLPDFWFPEERMWAEVKPEAFSPSEITKAIQLAWSTNFPVLMLDGTPAAKSYCRLRPPEYGHGGYMAMVDIIDIREDGISILGQDCLDCGCEHENPSVAALGVVATEFLFVHCKVHTIGHRRAIQVARSARFEHGETPRI